MALHYVLSREHFIVASMNTSVSISRKTEPGRGAARAVCRRSKRPGAGRPGGGAGKLSDNMVLHLTRWQPAVAGLGSGKFSYGKYLKCLLTFFVHGVFSRPSQVCGAWSSGNHQESKTTRGGAEQGAVQIVLPSVDGNDVRLFVVQEQASGRHLYPSKQ